MSGQPFFIVGCERSGTTLLMAMLAMHPRIAVPEVTWYYPRFQPYLHTYGDLTDPARFRVLAEEMIHGLKTPYFGLAVADSNKVIEEILTLADRQTFGGIFDAVLSWYARRVGKACWGEKTPHNLFYYRPILEDFPGAKFINMTRDGRDVAASMMAASFGPTNIYVAARVWQRCIDAAAAMRTALPPGQFLDISYEALAANPAETLRRVMEFIGQEYDDKMLVFHQHEIALRRARTKDHRGLGSPVSAARVAQYRQTLSLRERQIFAGLAREQLVAMNYEALEEPLRLTPEQQRHYEELDERIRAATLDAPDGHIVFESYNDWLADRREQRRIAGVWSGPKSTPDWDKQFMAGQRAPRFWKERFGVPRRYYSPTLTL